jgi:hypothetical protein
MKGTLHKTESGWQVWYHAKDDLYPGSIRVRILPLLSDDELGLFIQDTDSKNEGKEVEFVIFDNRQRCNCACHRDPNITHFVACCIDGYKTDNLGHVNYYAKLVDQSVKYPEVKIICPRCKALMPCECNPPPIQISLLNSIRANPSWETIIREFHIATQKVEKGAPPLIFECWLVNNYNPPTKKQN